MARTTPKVEQGVLISSSMRSSPVSVGSQQWFSWLRAEENVSFFFTNEDGSFTARKERRKRGGWYWIAYRSREGRLTKTYIGRSEDLTSERLDEIPCLLANSRVSASNGKVSSFPMLETKFTPPPMRARASRMLSRSELQARLNASRDVKLTLVTAPAGFGKTTLLSTWYEAARRRDEEEFAWISLDERDNEPTRFWSAIWSALRNDRAGGGINFSVPLYQTPQMSLEGVIAALLNGIGKSRRNLILILDDYHVITNIQIHGGMESLLLNLPPSVHIILSSRTEPPLSLGRARMYGEIVELQADDLRLSGEEIERFFRETVEITLTVEERAMLERRTEGWIAGLYLAGLALRGRQKPGEVLEHFTGSQRSLFDYFAEEVFAHQPEEVQHFLLCTSLPTELTPELCAAMLGGEAWNERAARARGILEYIERANVFIVPLDEQRRRYRYHALFSEFLRERLKQSMLEEIPALHQRAANWYEQEGMVEEAIEHALRARDMQGAQRLIERVGEDVLWRKGEVRRLLTWFQALPFVCNGESPHLEMLYAWAMLLSGRDMEEIEALLVAIERREEEAATSVLRGDIAAVRARIAGFRNDTPQIIAFSKQALQELPRNRALLRVDVAFGLSGCVGRDEPDESYRLLSEALHISQSLGSLRTAMFASRYLALSCIERGRLTEAKAIHQQALRFAGGSEREQIPATGIIYVGQAELLYEQNELAGALRQALLGVRLGERSGEIKVLLYGYCSLALIFAAMGENERAWQELWRAEKTAIMGGVLWLSELMTAVAVRLALLQGDAAVAVQALRKIGIDAEEGIEKAPAMEREYERLTLAEVWLAQQKYSPVVELLEPVMQAAREGKRVRNLLIAQSLMAIALSELRARRRAAQLLAEALALAEPEGYKRIFLDRGERMCALLQHAELSGSAKRYAQKLLAAAGVSNDGSERNGGLSKREYEVLQLVATGMSNQEIADALVVAVSTVKAHVKHICQKLGTQTRLQAVAKAREVGLLQAL